MINMINAQGLKFIDPTEEASKEWKKHINELSDISLFPTTRSTYMGGSLPGKAREQVNYAGGLAKYKEEIRAALPGWKGFRTVKLREDTKKEKSAASKSSVPSQKGVPEGLQAQPTAVAAH